jgi:hypothetical protein
MIDKEAYSALLGLWRNNLLRWSANGLANPFILLHGFSKKRI